MKKRIYTNKELALSFNERVLTFDDQALSFWVKGLTHFDVNAFTYTDAEMGESAITLDIIVEPEIQPAFDRYWYVDFRGEKFYLSTLTPSCVKDTTSLQYKYSLIFKSQRADLQRYEFANFVAVGSVQQPISYDFSLPMTIQDFVERMNINLDYYFGSGVWQVVLDPNYMSNINPVIYDGVSTVTVSFSRETLWSILTGEYEIFGLRWTIQSENGIMTIRLGSTPTALQHVFEYGKDKGLISIERINSNPTVYTRLSGKGSDRNLPYRYFDTATTKYQGDPDNNEFTQNIPYSALMPLCYRQYVKGWNDSHSSSPIDSSTYAYMKGYTDTVFDPVDYAIDEAAEAVYGVRKGSISDATDIYPTLQGVIDPSLGRIDEIVDVEAVLNDDIEDRAREENVVNDIAIQQYIEANGSASFVINSSVFNIADPFNKITFSYTQDFKSEEISPLFSSEIIVYLMTGTTENSSIVFSGSTPEIDYPLAVSGSFENLTPGNYSLKCAVSIDANSVNRPITFTASLGEVRKSDSTPYKQIFDIWIKNIWGTKYKDVGYEAETPDEYMHRVWDPLIIPNKELSVYFSDGYLAGSDYEFVVAKRDGTTNYYIYYDESKPGSYWRLSLIKSDVNYKATGLMLPNIDINAATGDHFFFTNIELAHNPYVLNAEARLQDYIEKELVKVNNENPTYAIRPSSIFIESYSENDAIKIGNKIQISNSHIGSEELTISNLSIEYRAGKLLPEWNITISEKPSATKNSIQVIQGDIKVLSSNLLSAQELTYQIQVSLDQRYLRKDGQQEISQSPTEFNKPIKVDSGISSDDFAQGQLSGSGFSLYKDISGDYILEIDKLNIRKTLYASELVINQVSIYGGIHLYSAAAMTASKVEDMDTHHRCFLDIKQGTVLNQFVIGDYAYCKRYTPQDPTSVIKYYWREVVGTGADYIDILKTGGDGDGVPETGDNIAQLGNSSEIKRQSAVIIDQTNGGSTTQYARISGFSLVNKDFVSYGVDPSTGRAYERIYGDLYSGGRNPAIHNYFKFDSSAGELSFRGIIRQESVVRDAGNNVSAITVDRGVFDYYAVYWPGNTVYWEGSTYYCDYLTTENLPSNTDFWHIYAAQGLPGVDGSTGATGAAGLDARKVDLTASALSVVFNTAGILVSPSSILLTANIDNFTDTPYYQFYDNSVSLGSPSVTNTKTLDLGGLTFSDMPRTIAVEVREGSDSGPIMARDQISVSALKAGTDGLTPIITNQNHSVLSDSDGNVLSYLGSGTMIIVYEGSTLLEYNTVLAPGKFAIGTPTVNPAGKITVGAITGSGTNAATIGEHSGMNASQDILTITYPITAQRQDGVNVALYVVQSINKTKQGLPGADGADGVDGADGTNGQDGAAGAAARVVHLLAPATVVRYNSGGLLPTPGSIDITAVANNTTGTVWYEFLKDNVVIQNTTSNTYSYTPPTLASDMPDMIQVNIREDSSTGAVMASDMVPIIGLVANSGIIQVAQSNPFVQFAADYTGSISDYSKSSEIVRVYEGDQILIPVPTESEPSNGEWLISYVQPVNISAGGRSIDGNDLEIGAASNMTTDTARIDYSIHGVRPDGRDFDTSFYQGFARFKDGADGKGYEYIYTKTINSSVPATPADGQTKSSLSPATTYQDDDWFPVNWTDDFTPPDSTYIYAWVSKRIKVNGIWGLFSTPKTYQTYVTDGADGSDGYDSVSLELSPPVVMLNCLANGDPRSGSLPFDVYILTKKGGVLIDDEGMTITPASNASIAYTKTWIADGINKLTFTGITEINSVLNISAYISNGRQSHPEASAVLNIKKQLDGYAGPGLISRGAWNAATQYTGSIQTVDVVSRKPSISFIWYQAKTTAGSIPVGNEPGVTPGWDAYWVQLGSYSSIATGTLFAENANVAEFIFNGGKMYSQEPSTAALANKNLILDGVNGKITALDAVIKGLIEATSGKIGNLLIENGNIIGLDSTGAEVIRFAIEDLPSEEDLTSNWLKLFIDYSIYIGGTATNYGTGTTNLDPREDTLSHDILIPYATKIVIPLSTPTWNFSNSSAVSSNYCIFYLEVYDSDYNLVYSNTYTGQEVAITSAGLYHVQITYRMEIECWDNQSTSFEFDYYHVGGVLYKESVRKTAIGQNGFYSYFSDSEYFHFKSGNGLRAKVSAYNQVDIPGVIASGTVSGAGSSSRLFGARLGNISKVTGVNGTYEIKHTLGHANYSVMATPQTAGRLCYVKEKYTNAVLICTTNTSGTLTDTAFDFAIVGNN